MHIYVANNTQQNRHFQYRLPERPSLRQVVMPPGRQVRLPDDLDDTGRASVVEQLHMAGAVPHDDPSAIMSPFSVLYRIGKQIGSDDIDIALERETEARQNVAADMVENTGTTNFAVVGANGEVQSTSLEVVQMENVGHKDVPEKDGVNVKIDVSKKAQPGRIQRSRKNGADK